MLDAFLAHGLPDHVAGEDLYDQKSRIRHFQMVIDKYLGAEG